MAADGRALGLMTWIEAEKVVSPRTPVIVPLGSTEQHGPHLPLATDTVMAEEWARRLAEAVDAFYLPALPYGQVWSARKFPGTISLKPETLQAVLIDIAHSLYTHGVRKLVLLSGHLGNVAVMRDAARLLLERLPDLKVLHVCYPEVRRVAEGIAETPFWGNGTFHAAELETALMLAVAPGLCRMDQAPCEYPEVPKEYSVAPVPWDRFSKTGVFGDARVATLDKGQRLLERWLEVMAKLVRDGFSDDSHLKSGRE